MQNLDPTSFFLCMLGFFYQLDWPSCFLFQNHQLHSSQWINNQNKQKTSENQNKVNSECRYSIFLIFKMRNSLCIKTLVSHVEYQQNEMSTIYLEYVLFCTKIKFSCYLHQVVYNIDSYPSTFVHFILCVYVDLFQWKSY